MPTNDLSVRPHRITYQDKPSTNSHMVYKQHYPAWDSIPCASFENVFTTIANDDTARTMIPIDNSIADHVTDIHHFLPTSKLHIIAEHFLRIQFALITLPKTTLETLRTVHSHVHTLDQYHRSIRELDLQPVIATDTTNTTHKVTKTNDPTRTTLSPPLTTETYDLEILAHDLEDENHNTTHFIVLTPKPSWTSINQNPIITNFLFNVKNLPTSLYKTLNNFTTNSVNMTKLENYIINNKFTTTQFLTKINNHPNNPTLQQTFTKLAFFTTDIKILNVYRTDPFRNH